jgi:hypothetical protein
MYPKTFRSHAEDIESVDCGRDAFHLGLLREVCRDRVDADSVPRSSRTSDLV